MSPIELVVELNKDDAVAFEAAMKECGVEADISFEESYSGDATLAFAALGVLPSLISLVAATISAFAGKRTIVVSANDRIFSTAELNQAQLEQALIANVQMAPSNGTPEGVAGVELVDLHLLHNAEHFWKMWWKSEVLAGANTIN